MAGKGTAGAEAAVHTTMPRGPPADCPREAHRPRRQRSFRDAGRRVLRPTARGLHGVFARLRHQPREGPSSHLPLPLLFRCPPHRDCAPQTRLLAQLCPTRPPGANTPTAAFHNFQLRAAAGLEAGCALPPRRRACLCRPRPRPRRLPAAHSRQGPPPHRWPHPTGLQPHAACRTPRHGPAWPPSLWRGRPTSRGCRSARGRARRPNTQVRPQRRRARAAPPGPHAGAAGSYAGLARARRAERRAPGRSGARPSREHMAEPLPAARRRRPRPPPSGLRPRPARYLEGLEPHKTRLAILILDDEKRTPIFIEGEGPDRRHGAAAALTFPNRRRPLRNRAHAFRSREGATVRAGAVRAA